jgi:hypothetical protein
MKILSIDVGIKNLALCILKIPDKYLAANNHQLCMTHLLIEKWEVINLCNDDFLCQWNNCISENNISKCNKKAFYTKNIEHYCKTHAKKHNTIKIPPLETKTMEKMKVSDILKFIQDNNIPYKNQSRSTKKELLLKVISDYYCTDYFEFVKTLSANDISLVDVGINLRDKMNTFLENENIDKVLIENQIGRLAIRMKSIQGMITQYLIMKNITNIDFISASNKLKLFVTVKLSYDERKKRGIEITSHLINISQKHWIEEFRLSKKKDDLADSFLQAIWYLSKNHNLEEVNLLDI